MNSQRICASENWGFHRFMQEITAESTVSDFDKNFQRYRENFDYSLDKGATEGWTALHTAARVGNLPVVSQIIKVGGEKVLHLENNRGMTALSCAAMSKEHSKAFEIAAFLLHKGVPLNRMTHAKGKEPPHSPLWISLEHAKNSRLAAYFMLMGGELHPEEQLIGEGAEAKGEAALLYIKKLRLLTTAILALEKTDLIKDIALEIVKRMLPSTIGDMR